MSRILLTIGNFQLQAYVLFFCISFLIGVVIVLWLNLHIRRPYPITPILGLWIMVPSILGARLFYCVRHGFPLHVWMDLNTGGLMFGGGLVFGMTALVIVALAKRMPLLTAFELLAPAAAFGEAIARVGCFLNGCCWGTVTQAPWGVRFPRLSFVFQGQVSQGLVAHTMEPLPVHPVQLYNTASLLALFVALYLLFFRNEKTGYVAGWYCIGYGCIRFVMRFFRADVSTDYTSLAFLGAQTAALALVLIGIGMLQARHRFGERLYVRSWT